MFKQAIFPVSPQWNQTVGAKSIPWPAGIAATGNEGATSTIKGSPNTLGYIELRLDGGLYCARLWYS